VKNQDNIANTVYGIGQLPARTGSASPDLKNRPGNTWPKHPILGQMNQWMAIQF